MTPAELARELDGGTADVAIVDLRAPGEVERWKVEGERQVLRVERAYWDVLGSPELLKDAIPEGTIAVIVCAYGGTAAIVAEELRSVGVDARLLVEGMRGWARLHVRRPVPDVPDGMYLVQLDRISKGCLSYVVGIDGGPALIVDPDRFYDDHLAVVEEHGSQPAAVVDTHLHADHVSGASALAAACKVPYFLADDHGASLEHARPADGEVVFGTAGIRARAVALHVPGHTPGSTGVLVADRLLLSGDTLFVEGVGRPDLGGQVEAWALDLHKTLTERLAPLPDDALVLPAHYQSRKELDSSGVYAARLGDLRRHAEFTVSADQFLADLMASSRRAPAEYAAIRKVNLGIEHPPDDILEELETGKNQCAAGSAGPR